MLTIKNCIKIIHLISVESIIMNVVSLNIFVKNLIELICILGFVLYFPKEHRANWIALH